MICRIWHGWTTPANADAYERLLREEVLVGIVGRQIPGFEEIQLVRRAAGDEVEFVTIMWFSTIEAVIAFAGADYGAAVVPVAARRVLKRFDERSAHYEVRERRRSEGAHAGQWPSRRKRAAGHDETRDEALPLNSRLHESMTRAVRAPHVSSAFVASSEPAFDYEYDMELLQALPLHDGYRASIVFYDPGLEAPARCTFVVAGSETISGPDGRPID